MAEFATFFLATCIDQVSFMEELVQPGRLHVRIMMWNEEEVRTGAMPRSSGAAPEASLYRDELPKGEVAGMLGTSDRNVRRATSALLVTRCPVSRKHARSVTLNFPRNTRFALDVRAVSREGVNLRIVTSLLI